MHKFSLNIAKGNISADALLEGPKGLRVIRMALDTGATYTIIPFETAIAIGVDPTKFKEKVTFITASSIEYAPVVRILSLKAFGFERKNIKVVCHNLPPQSPVEGLLGLNFLRYFNISLKFLDRILEISK